MTARTKSFAVPDEPMMAEADHRIANSLSLTAAMLRMQSREVDDEVARAALLAAESRLAAIAAVHSHLQSGCDDQAVDLISHLRSVLPDIGRSIGAEFLFAVGAAEPIRVPRRVAHHLTIAINELALNAVKHAYRNRPGGRISLSLECQGVNGLEIEVCDGGDGLPDRLNSGEAEGLGMRLVSSIVDQLGGTLRGRSDHGACFTIELPSDRIR